MTSWPPTTRALPPEVSSQPGPTSARSKSSLNGSVMTGVFALQAAATSGSSSTGQKLGFATAR